MRLSSSLIYTILLAIAPLLIVAQAPLPERYSSSASYICTWEATAPETNAAILPARSLRDVRQTSIYYDGLGRPLQTVMKQGSLVTNPSNPFSSAGAVDMVSAVIYDQFDREQYKYLPFTANNVEGNNSINDGLFKFNPFQQQAAFAAGQYPGETFYYNQNSYEPSPLNRVTETFAAGNSWVGTAGNANENDRHSVKYKYWLNTSADEVRIWNVTTTPNYFSSYGTPFGSEGIYPAGQLYKNVTIDEKGKQAIEFKNKNGFIILKKVQHTASADDGTGSNYSGWLCTYYIYDDLNNLRCVVQPKGVELLFTHNWDMAALNGSIVNEQCFRYEYDHRNRMITKKVPGAGPVQMVYDARDRLVMTQDANMALSINKQWLVTKYDDLNRPIATCKITDPAHYNDAGWHRNAASISISYPVVDDYTNELLIETHYDNYIGASGFSYNALYASGYNNYMDAPASDFPDPLTPTVSVQGLVTWTRVKVLGENNYITTCHLYDNKKRIIQVQTINYTGAMDIITNQYSFSGQLLRSHIKHQKGAPNPQSYELATKSVYDDLGRIVAVEKNLNGSGWKRIIEMTYDALGQLKTKKLVPAFNNNNGLETLTFDYNIRGWMLGANRDYTKSTSDTNHYFGFDLGYDKRTIATLGDYAAAQYNGNITGTVWKSKGDGQIRKYDFSYDVVNRLTGADFNQYNSGFNKSAGVDFSVSNLTYDANGNILSQAQKGFKVNASNFIDQLSYTYFPNSNTLQNVVDASNDTQTKLGDFRASQGYLQQLGGTKAASDTDYNYNVNGNLTEDKNKDITSIVYNHFKPSSNYYNSR